MPLGARSDSATALSRVRGCPCAANKSALVSQLRHLKAFADRPNKFIVQQDVTELVAFQQDSHCILTFAVSRVLVSTPSEYMAACRLARQRRRSRTSCSASCSSAPRWQLRLRARSAECLVCRRCAAIVSLHMTLTPCFQRLTTLSCRLLTRWSTTNARALA